MLAENRTPLCLCCNCLLLYRCLPADSPIPPSNSSTHLPPGVDSFTHAPTDTCSQKYYDLSGDTPHPQELPVFDQSVLVQPVSSPCFLSDSVSAPHLGSVRLVLRSWITFWIIYLRDLFCGLFPVGIYLWLCVSLVISLESFSFNKNDSSTGFLCAEFGSSLHWCQALEILDSGT